MKRIVVVGCLLIYQGRTASRVSMRLRGGADRCRALVVGSWHSCQCTRAGRYTHAGLQFCTIHARLARMNKGVTL